MFVGLVAAAIGAVWYLRRKQDDGKGPSSSKKKATGGASPFKFPDGKTGYGRNGGKVAAPKGKKARAKAKKAEKEKAKAAAGSASKGQKSGGDGGGGSQQAATSVINYTYFDSARRDTLIPIAKRKQLNAKDIMEKDAEEKK